MNANPPSPGEAPTPGDPPPAGTPPDPRWQVLPADLPQSAPWVTYSLLGITILVFLAQAGTEFLLGFDLPALLGMKVNEWIAAGELWRLFTPMLLHGGILHIAFNMYALGVIGPELERFYGHGRFFLLYVLAGFAGNVFSLTFTDANSLGASTAIFGLLGAQGVFIYQNRALFGARAQAALGRIVQLAVINLLIGLQPGIDNWGHIGGLVGGAAFAWVAGPLMVWQGILPYVRLADRRAPGRALLAAAGIGLLFALLAAGVILFRV